MWNLLAMTELFQAHSSADAAWSMMSSMLAAMGRVVLLLDEAFCVVRTGPHFEELVCPNSAGDMTGMPVSRFLNSRIFTVGSVEHGKLMAGERLEGRSAFVRCTRHGAQLVSISVVRVPGAVAAELGPDARFMLMIRPSEADDQRGAGALRYGLLAHAQAMREVVQLIELLSESEATVLITGETGAGKGAVAAALHAHSTRRNGPFVTVDVGALPADLLESELFGHVRGAFTGAMRDRVGRVELAHRGTLFLDEVGDLPLPLQAKLLRLVQEKEFHRIGDSAPRQVDARFIAATNVDLEAKVKAGTFREDLYYRLRVVPIRVPPLRERREEIEPLANYLLPRIGAESGRSLRLAPDAVAALELYDWPGNVRQLQNALGYAIAICRGQTIHAEHLPPEVRSRPVVTLASGEEVGVGAACLLSDAPIPLEGGARVEAEPRLALVPPVASAPATPAGDDELLRETLEANRWNRARTAEALGISRTTLWRRMRAQGLA